MSMWLWGPREATGRRSLFSVSVPFSFFLMVLGLLVGSLLAPLLLKRF